MKTPHTALVAAGALTLLLALAPESKAQAIWHTWDTTTTLAADSSPKWNLSFFGWTGANYWTEAPPAAIKLTSQGAGAGVQGTLDKNTDYWNPGQPSGSTLEFSLRVESQAEGVPYAAMVTFSNSASSANLRWQLNFTTSGVRFFDDAETALDMSGFNTYRITFTDTNASLYINNNVTPTLVRTSIISGGSTPAISFGDPGSNQGGETHWEYITWTNDGMYAPVPEPGTVAALLLGGGVLMLGYHRRRRA